MASPSPSDLHWLVRFAPEDSWTSSILHQAVDRYWNEAERLALLQLADKTLTAELLEYAVQRTVSRLENASPVEVEEALRILSRFYRVEVRRRRRANQRLAFKGTLIELEPDRTEPEIATVDFRLDVESLLREAPRDIRTALILRFGTGEAWKSIAKKLGTTEYSIRKRCSRMIRRLRSRIEAG